MHFYQFTSEDFAKVINFFKMVTDINVPKYFVLCEQCYLALAYTINMCVHLFFPFQREKN